MAPAPRVLDVGCGSGILAIAAGKLGARELLGVDPDPIAVEATASNARLNGLARRIHVRRGSVPTGEPPFELVLANLIASLLVQLAPLLRDEMAPGGRILASGIFRDREGDVRSAFEAAGLTLARRWAEEDWVALEAVRPQGSIELRRGRLRSAERCRRPAASPCRPRSQACRQG